MEYLFFDRLSGKLEESPESYHTLIGRWLIKISYENVFLNSVPVSNGDFLIPDPSGNWKYLAADGHTIKGGVAQSQIIDPDEAESIRALGEHLQSLLDRGANWLDWSDVVPLTPGMSEVVVLYPLEKMLIDSKPVNYFGHLESVCMRPRAHLHVEVERVSINKARRLPVNVASYLASHTEDWERPMLKSVLPKRILSEIRYDQVDIYENRVTARLIDGLVLYLNKRIATVRKAIRTLRVVMGYEDSEYSKEEKKGKELKRRREVLQRCSYQLAQRISKLWWKSLDASKTLDLAEATLADLERLKYRVMGLMDSTLYREVPRRCFVAPTIRTTNILSNDQHYRRVAEIWNEWIKTGYADSKSPSDVYKESQELCRSMDRFSLLLVMRAMEQLGYLPIETDLDKRVSFSSQWSLDGHGTQIECEWDENGRVLIEANGKRLNIVAVMASLAKASNDEQVNTLVDRLTDATKHSRTIVLYVGSTEEQSSAISEKNQFRLNTVGNDPRLNVPETLGILPVSAWDIGSVERVARALRWFLDSARFDLYPIVLQVHKEVRDIGNNGLFKGWGELTKTGSVLTVRRAMEDNEWNKIGIDQIEMKARRDLETAIDKHEQLSNELRDAVRKGNTKTLNPQKKLAHQQRVLAEQYLVAIEKLKVDLMDAQEKCEALLVCPVCGTIADPVRDFQPRDKGCFLCKCPECRSHWETRLCGNGHKYAAMLPGDFLDTDDVKPGWEDRTYGSDLLAIPARNEEGNWVFVCPTCGEIV